MPAITALTTIASLMTGCDNTLEALALVAGAEDSTEIFPQDASHKKGGKYTGYSPSELEDYLAPFCIGAKHPPTVMLLADKRAGREQLLDIKALLNFIKDTETYCLCVWDMQDQLILCPVKDIQ